MWGFRPVLQLEGKFSDGKDKLPTSDMAALGSRLMR